MDEVKKENLEEKPKENKLEKTRKNPWIVSTFVLGILIIVILITNYSGITGKIISEQEAGQAILNFANAQGLDASVVSTEKSGNFYLVTLSISGSEVPVYITKDGKYFTSSLIPLTAEEDTTDTTDTTPTTVDVPKTDKPVVDLFVMSYCPYGTQAEKGILPAVELLGDKIDFNLRFVYYAMHPTSGEVEENLRQYCIQKTQESKLNDYLTCFLDKGDSASCLTDAGINKVSLNSCVASADKEFEISKNKNDTSLWLNGNYPLFNVDKALNEQYKIGGSPTLVINGVQVSSARDPASYLKSICAAFSEGSIPEECSQQLSTTAYSAGFGYTASGSTTAAQCQ
jgi:hypothetical protein